MGQDLGPLTLLQPLQLLYKKVCFYFELLFSSEERILLYKKQKKKIENRPHRITLTYRRIGADEWHFCLNNLFQEWRPPHSRTDSIHLETSFALEKKNNDDFSLIWVKRPRTIKK